jgi:hypothetical protein
MGEAEPIEPLVHEARGTYLFEAELGCGEDLAGERLELVGVGVDGPGDAPFEVGRDHEDQVKTSRVSKADDYRAALRQQTDWDAYLEAESGLPGPRANLELVQVAAEEGSLEQFRGWLAGDLEYLRLCGAVGLGRLAAEGQRDLLQDLRGLANDPRWRVREGVAMGLQRLGARDMHALLGVMRKWRRGSLLERRAVVAALCEPPLLRHAGIAREVLEILDAITTSLLDEPDRRADEFKVLRKALAYGWSVAVVALPSLGRPLLEKWLRSDDRDVAWLARENLKKDRLRRMDAAWVAQWASRGT